MSNFFERILQIIRYYNINSVHDLAVNYLGYKSSQKINRLKNPETNPSFEILNDISNKFEDVNCHWLITGKGNMINKINRREEILNVPGRENQEHAVRREEKRLDFEEIPLLELELYGGSRILFSDKDRPVTDTIRIPYISGCDGAVFITGESMYPLLKPGDIVLFKQVNDINYIQFGEIYMLTYSIGGDNCFVVRYIQGSEIKKHIKLVSYNRSYEPIHIPVRSITSIAVVQAHICYDRM